MGESTQPEESKRTETAPEDAAEPSAEVEDLEVADEEISERVRGGRRAISIPY